jgi:hypothetical protein
MNSEKAIAKGFSIKPEQLKELSKVIDLHRHGQFSQFIQDAITEKLARLSEQERKAS